MALTWSAIAGFEAIYLNLGGGAGLPPPAGIPALRFG